MEVAEIVDKKILKAWSLSVYDMRVLMKLNGEEVLCYLLEMADIEILTLRGSDEKPELKLDFMKKTNTNADLGLLREWAEQVRDIELEATAHGEDFLAYLLKMVISEIKDRTSKIPKSYLKLVVNEGANS